MTHLGFITRESLMGESKPFQPDRELDITTPDDVLNLELLEPRVEPELLDDPRILARGETRVIFGFGSGDDHLA